MRGGVSPTIRVQSESFDLAHEYQCLKAGRTDIGAYASFTGTVRDATGQLAALTLEHYPGMTEKQLSRVGYEAVEKFDLSGLSIIHRYGRLEPGDEIVLVIAASAHRNAALSAVDYVMDHLKTQATFWKTEETRSGKTDWVAAKVSDDEAVSRWASKE